MSSSSYMQGHTASVVRGHSSRNASNTCGFFLDLLEPDFHILDAGCGPGSVTASLASLVPRGRAVGVDSSEDVIKKAQSQDNLPANCTFQTADLQALPFPDSTFDIVQTSQVLLHIANAVGAFHELRRVCKPGGFVACREGDASAIMVYPPHPGLEKYKSAIVESTKMKGAHPNGGRMLIRWALDAGFEPSDVTYSLGNLTYSGEQRGFWAQVCKGRLVDDETWRENIVHALDAQEADFKLMLEGWQAFEDDEAAVFAMPCGQVVCRKA